MCNAAVSVDDEAVALHADVVLGFVHVHLGHVGIKVRDFDYSALPDVPQQLAVLHLSPHQRQAEHRLIERCWSAALGAGRSACHMEGEEPSSHSFCLALRAWHLTLPVPLKVLLGLLQSVSGALRHMSFGC